MKRVETTHRNFTTVQKVLKYVEKEQFPDPAILHDFYKSYFNLVDLVDRYWYKVQETHGNWKWKSKMLLAIMRMAVINVWSISCQGEYEKWLQFRESLAENLTKIYF
jgi:hypothetical protein